VPTPFPIFSRQLMTQLMWLAVNIMCLPVNIRFDYTSTFVKFDRWEGAYEHVLQPLQGGANL